MDTLFATRTIALQKHIKKGGLCMAGKSPRSGRLSYAKPIAEKEKQVCSISECKAVGYTPVHCVQNRIPLDQAVTMPPETLTADDYTVLRQHGVLKSNIKRLYGFTSDGTYYNVLKKLGMHPEPDSLLGPLAAAADQVDDALKEVELKPPIEEKQEFAELGLPPTPLSIQQPVQEEQPVPTPVRIWEPAQVREDQKTANANSWTPRIQFQTPFTLKYSCNICGETHDTRQDVLDCFYSHKRIVTVDTDGWSEVYDCPMIVAAKLSNGDLAIYHLDNVQTSKQPPEDDTTPSI